MEVKQEDEGFKPITVTLETKKEAVLFDIFLNNRTVISEAIAEDDSDLDEEKICEAMEEAKDSWESISDDLDSGDWEKHFGKCEDTGDC